MSLHTLPVDHVIRPGDHIVIDPALCDQLDGVTPGKAYPIDLLRVSHAVITADDGGPQWIRLERCTKATPLEAAVHLTDLLDHQHPKGPAR
jgi:hypothetical protein